MRICFLFCLQFVISFTGYCQSEISRQDSGKCYALCGAPLVYRIEIIQVVNNPKHKKTLLLPASYLQTMDTVQLSSGDSVWQILPGIYDVTEEKILTGNGKSKTISKYIVLQEPTKKYTRADKKIKQLTIYEVADLPSKKRMEFPATYSSVSLKKLVNAETSELEIEVLCPEKLTEVMIDRIQNKLRMLGFAADNFSNELGETTEDSLKKFQQQNQLPIGGLNIPTLQLLGVGF